MRLRSDPYFTAIVACLALGGACGLAAADTLDRIRAGEAVVFGYRSDAAPFSFDDGGAPAGFTVALCRLIGRRLGKASDQSTFQPQWKPVSATGRFPALESGEIDALCGATSVTEARRRRMAFTVTTYLTDSAILVDAEAFQSGDWGKTIGVLAATTSQTTIDALLAEAGGEFSRVAAFRTRPEGVEALKNGEIDSLFGDRAILDAIRDAHPGRFVFAENSFGEERYAIAFRLEDTALRDLANKALGDAFTSGDIDRLHREWFGGRPLSEELRRSFEDETKLIQ